MIRHGHWHLMFIVSSRRIAVLATWLIITICGNSSMMISGGNTGVLAERAGGVGAAVRTYGHDAYLIYRISEPNTLITAPLLFDPHVACRNQ